MVVGKSLLTKIGFFYKSRNIQDGKKIGITLDFNVPHSHINGINICQQEPPKKCSSYEEITMTLISYPDMTL